MSALKKKVLILCTGNSCRSQMGEGIARHLHGDQFEIMSAGTHPSFVHPIAIEAMKEIGIDISGHRSKSVNEFLEQPIDYVITVCGNADQRCPTFPGKSTRVHWAFEDPEHNIDAFRVVRDQIFNKFRDDWATTIQ